MTFVITWPREEKAPTGAFSFYAAPAPGSRTSLVVPLSGTTRSHEPIGSCAPQRENFRFPDPFPVRILSAANKNRPDKRVYFYLRPRKMTFVITWPREEKAPVGLFLFTRLRRQDSPPEADLPLA